MAVLNKDLQEKIDNLEELAYTKFNENKIEEAFKLGQEAWDLYPEPKENWNEAYNTAKYIVNNSFTVKDLNRVNTWLNNMILVNNNLHKSDDELKYYIGKYYFEIGEYEEALNYLKKVVKETGFRYFEDEDPKYLDFIKYPNKYIKD